MATQRDQSNLPKRGGRGGARRGAGRPLGSRNRPGVEFVNRVKGLRVPESAPPEVRELADFALDRVIQCVAEKVPSHAAPSVLKGAALIFQLICEEAGGGDGLSLQDIVRAAAARELEDESRALPARPPADAEDAQIVPNPVDASPPARMSREPAKQSAPPPRPEVKPYVEIVKEQEARAADWDRLPPGWNRVP